MNEPDEREQRLRAAATPVSGTLFYWRCANVACVVGAQGLAIALNAVELTARDCAPTCGECAGALTFAGSCTVVPRGHDA